MTRRDAPKGHAAARCAQALSMTRRDAPKGHAAARCAQAPLTIRRARGFTLIEVLVALGIVALVLVAGLQATMALTNNAQRQSDVLLAQVCAENELIRLRLARQLPPVGESDFPCVQAGLALSVRLSVFPTPNPIFRRVDAQVRDGESVVLRIVTIVGGFL
jgi:general secretion pathway protein I